MLVYVFNILQKEKDMSNTVNLAFNYQQQQCQASVEILISALGEDKVSKEELIEGLNKGHLFFMFSSNDLYIYQMCHSGDGVFPLPVAQVMTHNITLQPEFSHFKEI